jgi:hypothetical protein
MSTADLPLMPNAPEVVRMQRRWSDLKSDRTQHEAMWNDIARLLRPQRGGFQSETPESRTFEKPLSSAPIMAQSNFAAGLYGTMTNPANQWFSFETPDTDVNSYEPMREWLDLVTRKVTASMTPAVSPFYSSATQLFSDLSCFGNAAQYDEALPAEGQIMDVTLSLAEVCADIDAWGRIVEVVRQFRLKPAAALDMFGKKNLPAKIYDLAEKGDSGLITFWHHVLKNDDFQPNRIGTKGKRWISRYGCETEMTLCRERGYDEMPFYMARWEVDTGHTYGVGPGFVSLASARVYEQLEGATIRMAQRTSDPTLLAPSKDDWPLMGKARPGAVVYGGVNFQGNQMIRPLELGGNFNLTLEERQAKLEEIKDAFHYTLMQLAGRTGMTATEVMTITEERQRLWAPHQGRVQEEFLAPKLSRRFSILWRAGQLPPPPKGMEGLPLQVKYQSAAAAAQLSTNGNAVLRVLQDLAPLVGVMPRIMDRIDPDGLVDTLFAARGVPAAVSRSREEADKISEERAKQQQMAQAMAMAEQGAGAAKDAAQAGATMAQAQGQGAPA